MALLTSIANRLTPSIPIQQTFAAGPVGTGTNITTLFGHKAANATGADYEVYSVVNVGLASAARAEVEAIAGVGSEIALMTQSFVNGNALSSSSNYPNFRVVLLPSTETGFGPNNEAFTAIAALRSDMFVSPYPASQTANMTALLDEALVISKPDSDLMGQFGTFVSIGSTDALSTALAATLPNSRQVLIHSLPDSASTKSQSEAQIASACAARMMGSGQPYYGLNGVTVGGLIAPAAKTDWIKVDPNGASEALLKAGYSPLYVQPGSTVGFVRTRTTALTLSDGVTPITNYFDWQQLKVLNDYAETLYYTFQQPPFNNLPGSAKLNQTLAGVAKDQAIAVALQFQDANMMQNVKALAPQFQAQINPTTTGRLDILIPLDIIPSLNVVAINLLATQYTTTLSVSTAAA